MSAGGAGVGSCETKRGLQPARRHRGSPGASHGSCTVRQTRGCSGSAARTGSGAAPDSSRGVDRWDPSGLSGPGWISLGLGEL